MHLVFFSVYIDGFTNEKYFPYNIYIDLCIAAQGRARGRLCPYGATTQTLQYLWLRSAGGCTFICTASWTKLEEDTCVTCLIGDFSGWSPFFKQNTDKW